MHCARIWSLKYRSVARSAFYRWFDEPLERFMEALAQRALAYAQAQQIDLSGPLSGVKDWYIVDSTTVTVRDALREEFPGTGDYAAIKVHKVLSVGCGAPVRYHFSPAREHDSRHLHIDESWRDCGLLADLAYASLDRLRACEAHGVRFVIRLKDNWKPKVDYIARGQVTQEFFPGTDLDALLEDEILLLDGRAIDADVHVGEGKACTAAAPRRRPDPERYCFFLTNLPPRIGPRQVADLYRVRWEVELSIRLDKSVNRLDAIDAERPCSLKTLLHASLMASTIAAILAHTHNLQTRPQQPGAPRMEAPLHPRRAGLAAGRVLSVHCPGLRPDRGPRPRSAGIRLRSCSTWVEEGADGRKCSRDRLQSGHALACAGIHDRAHGGPNRSRPPSARHPCVTFRKTVRMRMAWALA